MNILINKFLTDSGSIYHGKQNVRFDKHFKDTRTFHIFDTKTTYLSKTPLFNKLLKITVYLLTTLFILLSAGCKITGEYFSGDGFNNTELILKKDSTFIYKTFHDIGGTNVIEGKWTKHKNFIILNSNAKPPFKPNSLIEKQVPGQKKKLIIVQNMDVSAGRAIISVNNGQQTDTLNVLMDSTYWGIEYPLFVTGTYTNVTPIKSIRILRIDDWKDCVLRDSLFYVSNPASNLIIIYAQPYNQYYGMNYLVDAAWKLKRNRIYLWRQTKTKFAKDSYLRKR